MDLTQIWKVTLAQIEVKLDSPAHFKTWFKDTNLLEITGSKAAIGVKNSYTIDWLHDHHHPLIKETLSYVFGKELEPFYVIDRTLINKPQPKTETTEVVPREPMIGFIDNNGNNPQISLSIKRANLKEDFNFNSYIVGSSNKMAHAAALGVAKKPGEMYNPLFIYGKTGVGKTHLGQAVARQLLEEDYTKKILYLPSEGFLNDMVKSIKTGKTLDFRSKYRNLDMLIIDDIQFISKWQETQNEFFNTFNVLHNDKKQIVLISDRPPHEITGIEERLRSRFQGGITVDVGQPDYEMRLAIVEHKGQRMGLNIDNKVYEYIARLVEDNIRELEGALQKVSLYQSMFGPQITYEEVEKMLGKDKKSRRSKVKVPLIIKRVAKEFDMSVKDIKSDRRTSEIAFARQVAMFILREDFGFKLEQVATYLERKDHTTVLHAVDKIKSKLMIDEGFKAQMDMLRDNIMNENDL
jgi:chromosomal replication initiator protein